MSASLAVPRPAPPTALPAAGPEPIADPVDPRALAAEIAALPPDALLAASNGFQVFCHRAAGLAAVLREIGRLRELTFRQAGEGTGRALDLDRFDQHYLHLFLWNPSRQEIAGAYRLGPTDEIVPRAGAAGLYTHTLFRFGPRLLAELEPALELGRSFVAPTYQREYAPLMLLWRGIAQYVGRHPRYRRLFGAVSISAAYDSTTQRLLMAFLRRNHFDARLARATRARRPPPAGPPAPACTARTIREADQLVQALDHAKRGMPILLRQYLKLGGRLLGFNIDADFSQVLDGLIYVDLDRVDRAVLDRYLGPAADAFLAAGSAPRTQSERSGTPRP